MGEPWWAGKFRIFKNGLVPRLGGLPECASDARVLYQTALDFFQLACSNPRNSPNYNAFVSPLYAKLLANVDYIYKEEVISVVTNGVHIKVPSPRPQLREASTGNQEADFFTLVDILSGICKGTVLGGFSYLGQKVVVVVKGNGDEIRVKIGGVRIFRTNKSKTRNPNGRPITDFKENLLNEMYSVAERSVFLPKLQEIAGSAKHITLAFLADFSNAYKQLRLDLESWGAVCYLVLGRLFIELAMTFGWGPACRVFQHFAESFLVALAKHFPYLLVGESGERVQLPSPFTEVRGQVGLSAVFVDDYRYGFPGTREIAYDRASRLYTIVLFLHAVFNMNVTVDEIASVHVMLGRVWDYVDKVTFLPPDKLTKFSMRVQSILRGERVGFGKKQIGKGLFTGRDLAEVSGTLNYVAILERRMFPLITPVYRAADGLGLNSVKRLRYTTHRWLFAALSKCTKLLDENRKIPFSEAASDLTPKSKVVDLFTDASGGEKDGGFHGIGGLSYSDSFAFQIRREVFLEVLRQERFRDSMDRGSIIADEELLGQVLSVWLYFKLFPNVRDVHLALHVDNTVARSQIRKGRAKYEVQSMVLGSMYELLKSRASICTVKWIDTEEMKFSGADFLSRKACKLYKGIKVLLLKEKLFNEFVDEMFPALPKRRFDFRRDHVKKGNFPP